MEFRAIDFAIRKLIYGSAEYRFELRPTLEFGFFFDVGRVAPELSELTPGDFEKSYGAGVRLKNNEHVLIRIDYAHSREDNRIILTTGPAF